MTQKPKSVSFEKMWKEGGEYGAGLEDLARELYQQMIEQKVPLDRIRTVVYTLREMKGMDDYFTENYSDLPTVNAIEKKLRTLIDQHIHDTDGKAGLPLEKVKEAKET